MKKLLYRFETLMFALLLLCSPAHSSPILRDTPDITAQSCALIEAKSGRAIYAKNAAIRLPMASTTKIMTGLLACESGIDFAEPITITADMTGIEGSSLYLKQDELYNFGELVYAVLLNSANDASVAVAIAVAGDLDSFVRLMNARAREIGLADTNFTNPHGLDDDAHYTTSLDLALLTARALENEEFAECVSTKRVIIPENATHDAKLLKNHNALLHSYDGAIGVKTGFTKRSGRCLVSSAQRDGVRLVCVTLNDPNDWRDHTAMLDAGFAALKRHCLAEAGELRYGIPYSAGILEIANTEQISAILPSDADLSAVEVTYELPRLIFPPIVYGEYMGRAVLRFDGEIVAECALLAMEEAPAEVHQSPWERITEIINKITHKG